MCRCGHMNSLRVAIGIQSAQWTFSKPSVVFPGSSFLSLCLWLLSGSNIFLTINWFLYCLKCSFLAGPVAIWYIWNEINSAVPLHAEFHAILSICLKKKTAQNTLPFSTHSPSPFPSNPPLPPTPSLLQEVVARVPNDGTDIVLQRGPASCRWQALFTDCRVPGAGRETFPFPWTRRMPQRWGGTGCKLRLAATLLGVGL